MASASALRQLASAKLTSRSSSASCLMINSRSSPSSATTSATSSKNSSNSRVRNRRLRRRRKRSAPRECYSHRSYPDAVLQQLAIIDGHGPPSPMRQVSVPAMIGRAAARGRRKFLPPPFPVRCFTQLRFPDRLHRSVEHPFGSKAIMPRAGEGGRLRSSPRSSFHYVTHVGTGEP